MLFYLASVILFTVIWFAFFWMEPFGPLRNLARGFFSWVGTGSHPTELFLIL